MKQSTRLLNAFENIKKMMHKHEPIMDIPRSEFMALKLIEAYEGNIKMSDISSKLMITNAGTSQLISSLEDKGLVERTMSSADRRIIYVTLTNKSKKIIEETSKKFENFMDALVKTIGENDSEELIRIINKLEEALKEGKICREINH